MDTTYSDGLLDIGSFWEKMLSNLNVVGQINAMKNNYPELRSVFISYLDIVDLYPSIEEVLSKDPSSFFKSGEEVIASKANIWLNSITYNIGVRINNIPEGLFYVGIGNIYGNSIGKFIQIIGAVSKISQPKIEFKYASFKCGHCGEHVKLEQSGKTLKKPKSCDKCGEDGAKTTFTLLEDDSIIEDYREIEVVGTDNFPNNSRNDSITIVLEGDLKVDLEVGDQAHFTGVIRTSSNRGEKSLKTKLELFCNNFVKLGVQNYSVVSKRRKPPQDVLLNLIEQLDEGLGAKTNSVFEEAMKRGIDKARCLKIVDKLKNEGIIFSPNLSYLKVI